MVLFTLTLTNYKLHKKARWLHLWLGKDHSIKVKVVVYENMLERHISNEATLNVLRLESLRKSRLDVATFLEELSL